MALLLGTAPVLALTGVAIVGQAGFVVEVKQPVGDPLPNWLLMLKPYEAQQFSKWGWVSG